jgi:hypothetical protein
MYNPRFAEHSGQLGLPSLLNCFNGYLRGSQNAQVENQEQREKAFLSHRVREGSRKPGWQAAWYDQAYQQTDP